MLPDVRHELWSLTPPSPPLSLTPPNPPPRFPLCSSPSKPSFPLSPSSLLTLPSFPHPSQPSSLSHSSNPSFLFYPSSLPTLSYHLSPSLSTTEGSAVLCGGARGVCGSTGGWVPQQQTFLRGVSQPVEGVSGGPPHSTQQYGGHLPEGTILHHT